MSGSPSSVAISKAKAYSKPGICSDESKDLIQAARDYAQARLAYEAAVDNALGAGLSTIGAGLGSVGCLYLGPTPAGVACIAAAGFLMLGGSLWTKSSIESIFVAESEQDAQEAAYEEAMKKFCQCLHRHYR